MKKGISWMSRSGKFIIESDKLKIVWKREDDNVETPHG